MSSFSRDQKLASHSETSSHHAGNILMYLNQTASGSYSDMLSGNSILPHNYSESVGAQNEKFAAATAADTVKLQSAGGNSNSEHAMLFSRGLLNSEQNIHSRGLSLSLGSHIPSAVPVPSFQSQYSYPGLSSLFNPSHSISQKGPMPKKYDETPLHKDLRSTECMSYGVSCNSESSLRAEALCNPNSLVRAPEMLSDPLMHGGQGYENTLLNSKYLRPAQELLDEMANVQKALKRSGSGKNKISHENCSDSSHEKLNSRSQQTSSNSGIPTSNSSISELSPAERQELLDKKAKLMSMLDEVDEKYRQYCHQMQIVVSSFDMVAGCGAAESYTALALRTISRHFRCLRDAISGQIQLVQRKLGEQEGIPRLRYVDQQLRQQRSLQHLGVMRQAWRPQRGLPESSVSVLRAWLFEHFLHPYPKDSEKLILARQTGLSRNQVANWFINARVRLWKPMIEEMYQEEFGESEMLGNFSQENTLMKNSRDDAEAAKGGEKEYQKAMPRSPPYVHMSQFHHASTLQMDEQASRAEFVTSTHGDDPVVTRTLKSPDKNNFYSVKSMPSNNIEDGDLTSTAGAPYDLSELGHLAMNGQVSLALELRNCESGGYHGSGAINKSVNETSSFPGDNDLLDYHFMDPGKEQQRFGNPHLLHEFVV